MKSTAFDMAMMAYRQNDMEEHSVNFCHWQRMAMQMP